MAHDSRGQWIRSVPHFSRSLRGEKPYTAHCPTTLVWHMDRRIRHCCHVTASSWDSNQLRTTGPRPGFRTQLKCPRWRKMACFASQNAAPRLNYSDFERENWLDIPDQATRPRVSGLQPSRRSGAYAVE